MIRASLLALCGFLAIPTHAEISVKDWKEDLQFLARELPARHKNLYHRISKERFDAEVKRIDGSLAGMRVDEIRVALARLLALAKNGHTRIQAFGDGPRYPIVFREFVDGTYVVRADAEHAEAVGAKLVSIAGVPTAEARSRVLPLVPMETPLMAPVHVPGLLRNHYALRGTNIVKDEGPAEFVLERDGRSLAIRIAALPGSETPKLQGPAITPPMYLSDPVTAYWYRYLEGPRALYIQYNSCRNMKQLSFADFTRQVMEVADRRPVETVIIDLRHNGGGDSEVINPLVEALRGRPALRRKGRLFVLTSANTYSSGLLDAWRLRKLLHARVAGEASSQRPNTYGDVRYFELPNSKLRVDYCTKYFRIVSGDPDALPVDLPVPLTAGDYFAGRDPVLERVLATGRP